MAGQDPIGSHVLTSDELLTLCDVSMAMLGVAGFDGRLRWVNAAFVDAFGYSSDELLAMPSYLDLVHPDDVESVLSLLQTLETSGVGPPIDLRVRHKDGSWRWFRSSTAVARELVYFSGVDLSEERRRTEELAHANRSLSLFSLGVAHDLQSFLLLIDNASTRLALQVRENPDDREVDDLTTTLSRNTARASVFVGALLAVAHGDRIMQEPVGLGEIVAAAVDDVATEQTSSGASIAWRPDLPVVLVHAELIRATLANLFVNAIRACRGGPAPRIEIDASQVDDVVTVTVTDNGRGIPEADLAAVFEPFEQGSPPEPGQALNHPPGGYGLGLALCRQVVEAHGGRVWASVAPGGGTTMTIELPAAPSPVWPSPA